MVVSKDDAAAAVEKYGDAAYRFAYILTLSSADAEDAVCRAFTALSAASAFDHDEEDIRRKLFYEIYRLAGKTKPAPLSKEKIEAEYGQKPEEFYEVAALPKKKRAAEHLILYEGYSEAEAAQILNGGRG